MTSAYSIKYLRKSYLIYKLKEDNLDRVQNSVIK